MLGGGSACNMERSRVTRRGHGVAGVSVAVDELFLTRAGQGDAVGRLNNHHHHHHHHHHHYHRSALILVTTALSQMDARSLVLVRSGEVLDGLGSRSPRHSSALCPWRPMATHGDPWRPMDSVLLYFPPASFDLDPISADSRSLASQSLSINLVFGMVRTVSCVICLPAYTSYTRPLVINPE
ncbi:hypothetical protein IWX47DRAFT_8303 [Phyllosticta citricarpa]